MDLTFGTEELAFQREVRDWLKRESDDGKRTVKQIVFDGERLDVMSVRGWREKALRQV